MRQVWGLGLLALASTHAWAEPEASRAPQARVVLVGDSTLATRSGYGDALCARFRPELQCLNLARGGRSSASFRAEGLWDALRERLRQEPLRPTWVLIQFGHNDQPGKPGRSTDLATEFPVNLARYLSELRELGATPVLLTPLTRRSFREGQLLNDLRPWAEAALRVAAEATPPVAAIDLNALSHARVQAMGEDEADRLAMAPKPSAAEPVAAAASAERAGAAKSAFDRTHVGERGAQLFSALVLRELLRVQPGLAPYALSPAAVE
ncbi:rhamnogalacturonan acetylesterase [Kinneretia aquatilis]|uniref:rhamnogalacturonan acetylesterase n=1 Tax=Kinneretia aquatilis TaxID=2070761 RepID=UPI0014950E25|nr:rhamnogalacturonan acetylesterase [Paucibacter aquatile]WIV97880.1 rhamnogalacturonan acetylesterase [Paucibacter aquatile]